MSGKNLEAVGGGVALRRPALRVGQLWTFTPTKQPEWLLLNSTGRPLQDSEGEVGFFDSDAAAGAWAVEIHDEFVRLVSNRLMYLVSADGRVRLERKLDTEEEHRQANWQVLGGDGRPAFAPSCWGKGRKDAVVNDGWVAPHEQTPDLVPEPSVLANYSWRPFYKVTEEDIRFYDEHGWILLKQVVEPEVMDILHKEAQHFCRDQIARRNVCQIEMLRWQLNTFRDFLFYGPLGSLVHSFVRGSGVRVSTEALFGTVFNKRDPNFFSYQYHTDAAGQFGVFHGFATGTPAAAAWFPLHDVDAEITGGGIKIVDGFPMSICKYRNCGGLVIARGPNAPKEYNCPADCESRFGFSDCARSGCKTSTAQRILSFKQGDVVIWHSDMPHATQSTKQEGFARYAFTVRFVDSDAVMCDVSSSCGGWLACCKDTPLVSGQKVHSHCYPQVHPEVLDHEVRAHYSSTPKFLIGGGDVVERVQAVPPSSDCQRPANAKE